MSDKGHIYQIKFSVDKFYGVERVPILEINKRAITGEGEKAIQVYGSRVNKKQLDQLEVRADHRAIDIKVWTRDEEKVADYTKQVKMRAIDELVKLKNSINQLGDILHKDPKVVKNDINKNGVRNNFKPPIITEDML